MKKTVPLSGEPYSMPLYFKNNRMNSEEEP
ncbi:MAG: hypothetical protein BWX71_01333 [Deltaproteobacteria bacterium ADurb.Bin072]|jgi:hypothetical protein|nr:MAG: hypothetical protein BWX71_01333 [Deltaproteobacteria bacterium ADurb.Bin072]